MAAVVMPSNRPADLQRRGTTTATLTIPSRTGHRRRLKDYFVKASASSFSDISIGNVVWNRLYDNLAQAKFIAELSYRMKEFGFLQYMASRIPDFPFPFATQDESVTIARNAVPTRIDSYFEDVTEGDLIDRVVPGGSFANTQFLCINLRNNAAVSADGAFNFDEIDMPVGLNPFTDSQDLVSAGRRIAKSQRFTLYGIAGNFPKAVASKVTRVHIQDERTELFTSENQEGLFADPDNGNELEFDLDAPRVFWLKTPYVLMENRLLTFTGEADHDGTNNLPADSLQLFLLGMWERNIGA